MSVTESSIQGSDAPIAAVDRTAAGLRGLRLLTVAAAAAALIFSLLLAGTGPTAKPAWTSATSAMPSPVSQAAGTVAVNTLDAGELAEQLPGIGPVYAARMVHTRTLFGPLHSAADLRALGIPDTTLAGLLPLISFRA